jgi:hypothetical protein
MEARCKRGRVVVPRMNEDVEEERYDPPPKESTEIRQESSDVVKGNGRVNGDSGGGIDDWRFRRLLRVLILIEELLHKG